MTLELAVLAPVLLLLVAFVVAAGRIELAGGAVENAAQDSARAASLARTPTSAQDTAQNTAQTTLTDQHLDCSNVAVTVDTSGFATPLGQPAAIRVQVSCRVELSDVALPGLPGTKTLQASFTSPLDPYRSH